MATGWIEQQATLRFELLRELDTEVYCSRMVLGASGVPSDRIEALYPFDFCALLPEIIEHLRSRRWDPYSTRYPSWASLKEHKARLIDHLSQNGLMTLTDELCRRSGAEAAFWNELIALLDAKVAETSQARAELSNAFFYDIVESLFVACWLMANLSEVHSEREAHEYFLDVSARLLLTFAL